MHPVRREHDPAPLVPAELRRDPGRPEPGVAEGEGHHPLLDEGGGLVGHAGPAALPGAQYLRAEPEGLGSPPVERGGMDPHGPAGRPHVAQLLGQGECSQPEPVQGIIGGQGGASFPLDWQVKREEASPLPTSVGGSAVSLQLGDRTH